MRITRFGMKEIFISTSIFLLGCAVCTILFLLYASSWLLLPILLLATVFGWVLWFFRDPKRDIPGASGLIVSPADGVVTHLDTVTEPDYIGGQALRCSIFLSLFDPHLNRAPAAGTVEFLQYRPGAFHDARSENSLTKNENQDVGFVPSEANFPAKMLIRQSSGAIARRIVCPVEKGRVFTRGETYGMIKFGSRTTLFITCDREIEWKVNIGDPVKAGETVLAVVTAVKG